MFKKFLNIIKNLSLDFPKEKIIIKPHPTEDINNWRSHFKSHQYKNIIIDNSFDITAYIAASKCVIFNSSTAGAQAVIMGKKARFMITGDPGQIDLTKSSLSGLKKANIILQKIEGIEIVYLDGTDVIRHKLVTSIIEAYNKNEDI